MLPVVVHVARILRPPARGARGRCPPASKVGPGPPAPLPPPPPRPTRRRAGEGVGTAGPRRRELQAAPGRAAPPPPRLRHQARDRRRGPRCCQRSGPELEARTRTQARTHTRSHSQCQKRTRSGCSSASPLRRPVRAARRYDLCPCRALGTRDRTLPAPRRDPWRVRHGCGPDRPPVRQAGPRGTRGGGAGREPPDAEVPVCLGPVLLGSGNGDGPRPLPPSVRVQVDGPEYYRRRRSASATAVSAPLPRRSGASAAQRTRPVPASTPRDWRRGRGPVRRHETGCHHLGRSPHSRVCLALCSRLPGKVTEKDHRGGGELAKLQLLWGPD